MPDGLNFDEMKRQQELDTTRHTKSQQKSKYEL